MKKTILLTGGSGLLALNWAIRMRNAFNIVLCLHERHITLAGVQLISLNLDSVEEIKLALEQVKPSVVIHTAGLTSVEKCEKYPLLAKHLNVTLAQNVAIATARLGIKMVHISTDHLFAGDQPLMKENDTVQSCNVYAATKAEAEKAVLVNPETLIVRTNFYGWGPSYRNSFSDVIIGSLAAGKEVVLFDNVFYSPILVEPMVDAVHDLIDINTQGIFNVVSGTRVSKYQFGSLVAKRFGLNESLIKKGLLQDNPNLVKRPLDMSLSNIKLINTLGRNIVSLEEQVELLYMQNLEKLNSEIRSL